MPDSGNVGLSASLRASPALQDTLGNLRGLMSKHEVEVTALEAENRQLREQVAKLAQDAFRSSLSESLCVCKQPRSTPANADATHDKSSIIQPPKESLSCFQTEGSCFSSALGTQHSTLFCADHHQEPATAFLTVLRAAADGSAADSAKQCFDDGISDAVVDRRIAHDITAADISSHHSSAVGHSIPQPPRERACTSTCTVVAASSAAMRVAAQSAEEPW
jgi:hypothetical protein